MKSVTSFFDTHTLRKDVTRFSPAWLVYLIGGILVMLALTSAAQPHRVAESVSETLVPFAVINMIYAGLAALLLFGDLFNSRLCNALHAMPLRREQWFVSHVIAGLCFSIVPNTLGILLIMPRMGEFWFVGLLWLLAMTLQYIFFFGLAVFSVFCTGNRFAAAAVYTILNFGSVLASAFVAAIYQPLLFGIQIDTSLFAFFSPIYHLLGSYQQSYISIEPIQFSSPRQYTFTGLGSGWTYLWIIAATGIVLLVLSLLMYRRRALEAAGDFMAVRPLAPVFSIAYTLMIGILFAAMGEILIGEYVGFLLVGIVVGYFTGQILLQRTVKVFKIKTFLKCGAFIAALLLSMLATWLDPLGITRYVPDPAQVKQVQVSLSGSYHPLTLAEAEDLLQIAKVHQRIVSIRDTTSMQRTYDLSLRYTMKDGSTVTRDYDICISGDVYQILKNQFSYPDYVLAGHNWEKDPVNIRTDTMKTEERLSLSQSQALLAAMTADCGEGAMAQPYLFHGNDGAIAWITVYTYNSQGGADYREIRIYESAYNTIAWLKSNGYLE